MSKSTQALYVLSLRHEEVARVLDEWFGFVKGMGGRERSEIWGRSAIGRVVKSRLVELGHWKNRERGNPAKGYKAMCGNLGVDPSQR
jgi:hypothetical protein